MLVSLTKLLYPVKNIPGIIQIIWVGTAVHQWYLVFYVGQTSITIFFFLYLFP